MSTKHRKKGIGKWLALPLCFLCIGYFILYVIARPYIRPMVSLYGMIAQNQAPDFSEAARNLFEGNKGLPTKGKIKASSLKKLKNRDTYGKVIISDVSIDVPLIYGSDEVCLYMGAGQRLQSSQPGFGKPIMIAGHTIPYFKNLGLVKKGQIITIETFYGIFQYKITGTKVASASDPKAYNLKQKKEQLILFTCYPLDGIGEKEDRLFVYADKISGVEVVGE